MDFLSLDHSVLSYLDPLSGTDPFEQFRTSDVDQVSLGLMLRAGLDLFLSRDLGIQLGLESRRVPSIETRGIRLAQPDPLGERLLAAHSLGLSSIRASLGLSIRFGG